MSTAVDRLMAATITGNVAAARRIASTDPVSDRSASTCEFMPSENRSRMLRPVIETSIARG